MHMAPGLLHAGLGKTALAHVVSQHCGFRPVEINASDERSGPALTARIKDAVQMRAVMGAKRPNCVIIDEVDGAAGKLSVVVCMRGGFARLAWRRVCTMSAMVLSL